MEEQEEIPSGLDQDGSDITKDHTEPQMRQVYDPRVEQFNKDMVRKLGLTRRKNPAPTCPRIFEVPNWVLECRQYDEF